MKTRPKLLVALGTAAVAAACLALAAAIAVAALGGGSTEPVKAVTAKFHDLATAKQSGYGLLKDKHGIACIAMDSMPGMGAMGIHYAKPKLVGA